jgi:hypothetical protein
VFHVGKTFHKASLGFSDVRTILVSTKLFTRRAAGARFATGDLRSLPPVGLARCSCNRTLPRSLPRRCAPAQRCRLLIEIRAGGPLPDSGGRPRRRGGPALRVAGLCPALRLQAAGRGYGRSRRRRRRKRPGKAIRARHLRSAPLLEHRAGQRSAPQMPCPTFRPQVRGLNEHPADQRCSIISRNARRPEIGGLLGWPRGRATPAPSIVSIIDRTTLPPDIFGGRTVCEAKDDIPQ